MGRGDRLLGENQYDDLGFVDRSNDLVCVKSTRDNISGRDPALQPRALERPDNGIGDGGVLRGIAYEYVGVTDGALAAPDAVGAAPVVFSSPPSSAISSIPR
jgi:hypothetical protein